VCVKEKKERSDCCITEKVFLLFGQHEGGLFFTFSHSARGRRSGRIDDVHAGYVKWGSLIYTQSSLA
jgi:hypothetical protein